MAGFSSIGRAIGGAFRAGSKIPGVGGVLGAANKVVGSVPGMGGIAGEVNKALAPRPTNPQLGIATGSASETTATNPLGTPRRRASTGPAPSAWRRRPRPACASGRAARTAPDA